MGKDYYKILGVSKKATEKEIKRSYKRKAIEYRHPSKDRDPNAEQEWKDIYEAYRVLSDPKKRQVFDELGEEGLKDEGDIGVSSDTQLLGGTDTFDNLLCCGNGGGLSTTKNATSSVPEGSNTEDKSILPECHTS